MFTGSCGHIDLHLGDDSGFKAVRAGDELGRRRWPMVHR